MALSDRTIKMLRRLGQLAIEPFVYGKRRTNAAGNPAISYGLGSYGYDIRLAPGGLWWLPPDPTREIDPKNFDRSRLVALEPRRADNGDEYVVLPAGGFMLAYSLERIGMPADCTALCLGKSSYARVGVLPLTTPLEAGWGGHVTLEIVNLTGCPVRLYLGEGICQVVFLRGDQPCAAPYDGPYQNQGAEVVPPRVGGGA